MNSINFEIRDLRVLKYIKDYERVFNRVIDIKKVFNFNSRVIIDVLDNLDELSELLDTNVPKWVIGTSFDNVILILDYKKWNKDRKESFDDLILHEFVHVVLNQKSKKDLPIWLNEAFAMYFSGQYLNYENQKIKLAKQFDFYELDYKDSNLYHISIYTFIKLIKVYGLDNVINESLNTLDLKNNSMFNNDNLLNIFYE